MHHNLSNINLYCKLLNTISVYNLLNKKFMNNFLLREICPKKNINAKLNIMLPRRVILGLTKHCNFIEKW